MTTYEQMAKFTQIGLGSYSVKVHYRGSPADVGLGSRGGDRLEIGMREVAILELPHRLRYP
jgi:hypothetical protein